MKGFSKLLAEALQRKADYRQAARAMSWEEKVASIERMRAASAEAKRSMLKSLSEAKAGEGSDG